MPRRRSPRSSRVISSCASIGAPGVRHRDRQPELLRPARRTAHRRSAVPSTRPSASVAPSLASTRDQLRARPPSSCTRATTCGCGDRAVGAHVGVDQAAQVQRRIDQRARQQRQAQVLHRQVRVDRVAGLRRVDRDRLALRSQAKVGQRQALAAEADVRSPVGRPERIGKAQREELERQAVRLGLQRSAQRQVDGLGCRQRRLGGDRLPADRRAERDRAQLQWCRRGSTRRESRCRPGPATSPGARCAPPASVPRWRCRRRAGVRTRPSRARSS